MVDYDILNREEYKFLKGLPVCYLVVSGSVAYGTNNENSDLDIRGCYLEDPTSFFEMQHEKKGEVEDKATDTVVYALRKYAKLLCQCNPNIIESLGVKDDHIIFMNEAGKMLRSNYEAFLSKRAYVTFAQYANAQLRRLENALARDSYPQPEKEKHIMKSIEAQMMNASNEYKNFNRVNSVGFEILPSDKEEFESEIYINMEVSSMPLRDFLRINADMANMIRNYWKLNKRNHKKDLPHLRKHAMHLIRLYLMGIDILKDKRITTYREERDMLLAIRNGDIGFDDVFKMQKELSAKLDKVYENSLLPETADTKRVNAMLKEIYMKELVKRA